MSSPPPHPVQFAELRRLAALSRIEAHRYSSSNPTTTATAAAYTADLQSATTELRRRIFDEEMKIGSVTCPALSLLCLPRTNTHSKQLQQKPPAQKSPRQPRSQLHVRAEIRAHERGFAEAGYIPPPASPTNTVLACRSVAHAVAADAAAVRAIQRQLDDAARALAAAKALYAEQQALHNALLPRLQDAAAPPAPSTAGSRAARTAELHQRARILRQRTARTVKALQRFLSAHLAAQLALEERGGPVAGLGASPGGEAEASAAAPPPVRGQTTLKQAFAKRRKPRRHPGPEDGEEAEEEAEGAEDDSGAASEMRRLLEDLMNACLDDGGPSHVVLPRESAAARFLVRARVALFHPRDARRIRLVDFGGCFE